MLYLLNFSFVARVVASFVAWRINSHMERKLFRLFQTIHTGATEFWLHDDGILVKPGRHTLAVVAH